MGITNSVGEEVDPDTLLPEEETPTKSPDLTPAPEEPKLSYGQRAVGLNFNPDGDPKITEIKSLFAKVIDLCDDRIKEIVKGGATTREEAAEANENIRLLTKAITESQTAQMWAVKGITYLK